MKIIGTRSTLFVAGLCSLWLGLTGHAAQGPSIAIIPADPTMSVGQFQQFTVTGAVTPTGISAGGEYTCIRLSDGTVRCTGRNQFGQLANGTYDNTPVLVLSSLTGVTRVAAGDEFGCALLGDGSAMCWGLGESGQHGDGTFQTFSQNPTRVIGLTGAVALASGYSHACALMRDGSIKCWGGNTNGELGDGSTTHSPVPVAVSGIVNAVAITSGAYHSCAVLSGGTVQCWGFNGRGQLGDGTITDSSTPVTVPGISSAIAVAGGGVHTCALLREQTVRCWGDNEFGQVGDGTVTSGNAQVVSISSAVAISAGWRHSCARLGDGTVRCWGQNDYGQLGDGTTTSSATPVAARGITSAVDVTAGWWHHSCALLADGTVRCWGTNEWGQLGSGTTTSSPVPIAMSGTGITWTSSNAAVATIDPTGRAVAIDSGAATIRATDTSGASASTTLTVRDRAALSVIVAGTGTGSVNSNPNGIICGTDCSELYDIGTTVTLTASADSRSTLTSWSGCDSVSGATCTVTVNAAKTVAATFNLKRFVLTVNTTGLASGSGTVTSSPQGINCGTDCSEPYTIDTVVTLTADPSLLFTGWNGCDTVSGATCTVTMRSAKSVTASFLGLPF